MTLQRQNNDELGHNCGMTSAPMPMLPALAWPGPPPTPNVLTEELLSAIANRVGDRGATSKAELVRLTLLPRSTVSGHVDWLLNRGLLSRADDRGPLRRGRPADNVELNGRAGSILAVDMGVVTTTAAIVDLRGRILARRRFSLSTEDGPGDTLQILAGKLEDLVLEAEESGTRVAPRGNRVASVAFPARIDFGSRSPLRPTVMPSWDGFPVGQTLEDLLGCPVVLENDCAVRAVGEAGHLGPESLPLVTIQLGTGIGAGIVDGSGEIYRGANGSAGDVGHIPCSAGGDILCNCGARGCVEAVAAVPAILQRLEAMGLVDHSVDLRGSELLAHLLKQRDPQIAQVVRESAEILGEVVATLCNVLNPRRVVVTSALAAVSHDVLAGVRSVVYARARALATKDLVIDYSTLGDNVGIAGAYLIGRRHLLTSTNIKRIRIAPGAGHTGVS